jgi:hypothetical protein
VKIFAISDVHADYRENRAWLQALSETEHVRDALIVAGDISHDTSILEEVLELLRERFGRVFFVPGNHDLWLRGASASEFADSLEKYRHLRALCDRLDVTTEPALLGEGERRSVWVVPLYSWYEMSEESETGLFVAKKDVEDRTDEIWVDNVAVQWPDFGGGISAIDYFIGLNEPLPDVSETSAVLTFSHFLPRSELMFLTEEEKAAWEGPLVDPMPSFNFSRVAGTLRLERQLRRLGSTLHVYGHQHRNRSMVLDGVRYLSHCLAYPRERSFGRARNVGSVPLLIWDTSLSDSKTPHDGLAQRSF